MSLGWRPEMRISRLEDRLLINNWIGVPEPDGGNGGQQHTGRIGTRQRRSGSHSDTPARGLARSNHPCRFLRMEVSSDHSFKGLSSRRFHIRLAHVRFYLLPAPITLNRSHLVRRTPTDLVPSSDLFCTTSVSLYSDNVAFTATRLKHLRV